MRNASGVSILPCPSMSSMRSPSASEIGPGTCAPRPKYPNPAAEGQSRGRGYVAHPGYDRDIHGCPGGGQPGVGGAADNQGVSIPRHDPRQPDNLGGRRFERRLVVDAGRLVRNTAGCDGKSECFLEEFPVGVEQASVRRRHHPDQSNTHGVLPFERIRWFEATRRVFPRLFGQMTNTSAAADTPRGAGRR